MAKTPVSCAMIWNGLMNVRCSGGVVMSEKSTLPSTDHEVLKDLVRDIIAVASPRPTVTAPLELKVHYLMITDEYLNRLKEWWGSNQ